MALLGLLVAAGQALWSLFNFRAPFVSSPPADGLLVTLPGGNLSRQLRVDVRETVTNNFSCPTGNQTPDDIPGFTTIGPFTSTFERFEVVQQDFVNENRCGPGTNVAPTNRVVYRMIRANGTVAAAPVELAGGVAFTTSGSRNVRTLQYRNFRITTDGVTVPLDTQTRDALPEGIQAEVPEATEATAAVPAVAPVVPLLPAAVPGETPATSPVPSPAPAPGGLPGSAPAPAPRPRPAVTPAPEPAVVPALPAAQPVPAAGPLPTAAPPVPVTQPGTTFLPGGVQLPSNGPPPTMEGIASEVGKLEKKLEILLSPDEPLSLLQQINRAIDQIENIRFVLDALFPEQPYEFPAGEYQLAPVCDRDSEGMLEPPRTAAWAAGQGEVVEVRRKLDALAQLIQHHKDLKQPTCGGPGAGPHSNVTVHFESD